jgi:hypothetical protein
MEYFCFTYKNQNDVKLQAETGNWFFITANNFGSFAKEDRDFQIGNKKVLMLTQKLSEIDGFSVYAGEDGNDLRGKKKFSRTILITRPGQLPYTPVTRKQYLLTFLQYMQDYYNANITKELKKPRRTDAEEKVVWQKGYDEIVQKNSTNEKAKELALSRYTHGYVTDKEEQQNNINRMESNYQQNTQPAKDFLANHTEEELAMPAILNTSYPKGDFKQFITEDKGKMMVQINENYFNSELPTYIPQFLVVDLTWGSHNVAVNFANQVEKNFDFSALQQMIDK